MQNAQTNKLREARMHRSAKPIPLSVLETVAAREADRKEDDESQDEDDEDDNEPHLLVLPPHLAPQRHTCTP